MVEEKIKILDKKEADIFYERNDKKELIPKIKYVEELKSHIEVLPLLVGEWRDIRRKILTGDESFLLETVSEKIVNPKFTVDELTVMKPWIVEKFWDIILLQSALEPEKPKKGDSKNLLVKEQNKKEKTV